MEVSVKGSFDAVFTVTFPNARLVGLIVNCETVPAAFSCRAKLLETEPALAVKVTACEEVKDETLAVNPALVAFTGTTSVAGTVTAALLLARLTLRPPVPAATVSVTVQLSLPDAVMDALLQDKPLNAAAVDVPVAVGLFAAVPQPNGERATRRHADIANSSVYRPLSLLIEPRLQAPYELSTSVTYLSVRALHRDQEKNRS